MAFEIKFIDVKTEHSYSLESLYEAIKDKNFTAGKPSIVAHGIGKVISFPEIDKQNQIWILKGGFGKETKKFTIQKYEKTEFENTIINDILSSFTDSLSNISSIVSDNTNSCEKLVKITAEEFMAFNL